MEARGKSNEEGGKQEGKVLTIVVVVVVAPAVAVTVTVATAGAAGVAVAMHPKEKEGGEASEKEGKNCVQMQVGWEHETEYVGLSV